MKKLFYILIFFLLITGFASAVPQFRLQGAASMDFIGRPSFNDVVENIDIKSNIFTGIHWEVITESKFGFGSRYLIKFYQLPSKEDYVNYDWWMDWSGDIFLSYHFFRADRFLDPFVMAGYGCAGRVELIYQNDNYWTQSEKGEWYYDPPLEWEDDYRNQDSVTHLSLFPYVGAGISLNFKGFILGANASYRPFATPVPATQFAQYPLKNIQVVISAGAALGCRKCCED